MKNILAISLLVAVGVSAEQPILPGGPPPPDGLKPPPGVMYDVNKAPSNPKPPAPPPGVKFDFNKAPSNAQEPAPPPGVDLKKDSGRPPQRDPKDLQVRYGNIECRSGVCSAKLRVVAESRCHMGDIDSIESDLQNAGGPQEVLLTVESLDASQNIKPYTQRIPFVTLRKGVEFKYTFPRFTSPVAFGVFVCRDHSKKGSCQAKDPIDVGALPMMIAFGQAKDPNFKWPDYIYYFQLMFREKDSRILIYDDSDLAKMGGDLFERRRPLVLGKVLNSQKRAYHDILRKVEVWSKLIRSVPLEPTSGTLAVILPKLGEDCAGQTPDDLFGKGWEKNLKDVKDIKEFPSVPSAPPPTFPTGGPPPIKGP